jgi:OOP family OmpA-OmpF porin
MKIRTLFLAIGLATATLAGAASDGNAQLGSLKKVAKEAAARRAAERAVDAVANATLAPDSTTASAAITRETPAAAEATSASAAPTSPRPGEGAWVNYDFVPGERPLLIEDFTADAVGDFPRRFEFMKGNMEIAEWQGGRYLRATSVAEFALPLPETLPERFTIEFDYAGANKYDLEIRFSEQPDGHTKVLVGAWEVGVSGGGVQSLVAPQDDISKRFVRVRVMADGKYVKVYLDDQRVANVPNANLGRANKIWLKVPVYPGMVKEALLGEVRVMAGGKKLYDALAADGRVTTQGILFDTGSNRLRPESTPTLKEIAGMLKDHPELRLRIEGHTDALGDDTANQKLSEDRAAAVVAFLVESHGIDAARIESVGLGETKPATQNDTPEGRQANRRVELVRM